MMFSSIDNTITHESAEAAIKRFGILLLELGIRNNNEHVGSGLGGNNFQLVVLLSINHNLVVKNNAPISVADGVMNWQASWLRHAPMLHVRKILDSAFAKITERYKLQALAYESLIKSSSLLTTLAENIDSFPNLDGCLRDKLFDYNPKLSYLEQLVQAYIICQELSRRLDVGDESTIRSAGAALDNFPNEIILLSVRRYISIDRLVRHNLDEDPVFAIPLIRINNLFMEEELLIK